MTAPARAGATGIALTEFRYDEWAKPPRVRDTFDVISRPGERGPDKPELTRSYELPGKHMTAEEFAEFKRKGGKINYGDDRIEKQELNDERHEQRAKRHPLMDIVIEVVANWDCSEYLGRHRKAVREILAIPRNARRRRLEGLSTKARRHQQAIKLIHALAFDNLTAAEYCRRHDIHPADASRMLAHLYDKEPRLADDICAINACAAAISWQFRQRQQLFHYKERGLRIDYGWNYDESADNGEMCDYDSGQIRSIYTGRFKPTSLINEEPFKPFDLHKPETWRKLGFPVVAWDALYEPMRAVERYAVPLRYGKYDRYRDISRQVLLKSGRKQTWRIGRAIPLWRWAIGYCPQKWHPVPNIWVGWDPTRVRYETVAIGGGYVAADDTARLAKVKTKLKIKKRWLWVELHLREVRWSKRSMCNPVRLFALPPAREPHGLFAPFTRCNWILVPVSDVKETFPLLFFPAVTAVSTSSASAPQGGTHE